jgi:hypothetical protein
MSQGNHGLAALRKAKLPLCFSKHYVMKMYGEVNVQGVSKNALQL